MTAHLITCRYGKTYAVRLEGSMGAKRRTVHMLENCCCWVCYNRSCSHPKNEVLPDCGKTGFKDCELFTKTPYCKRAKTENK